MHFLKTQLFHYALLQKAEPNSSLFTKKGGKKRKKEKKQVQFDYLYFG